MLYRRKFKELSCRQLFLRYKKKNRAHKEVKTTLGIVTRLTRVLVGQMTSIFCIAVIFALKKYSNDLDLLELSDKKTVEKHSLLNSS